jgi:transcriptional regulator with XRE-family HTH domain
VAQRNLAVGNQRNPTVAGRELGALLRRYREGKGLTLQQVAGELEIDASQVSRFETAQRKPRLVYLKEMCRLYGLDAAATEQMVRMLRESNEEGWWKRYELQDAYEHYVSLESATVKIEDFEITVVPGLMQTEEYAAAVIEPLRPELSNEQIHNAARSRLKRQEVLDKEDAFEFHAIIDEGVLNRVIGGRQVMYAQLEKLCDLAERTNIQLQVLPFLAGSSLGLEGSFSILYFEEEFLNDLVYTEGPFGQVFQDKKADFARCERVFGRLAAIAATPQQSLDMVRKHMSSYS